MPSPARILLALAIMPSVALAQVTKQPAISGTKIDAVKALPMPQGVKDLLIFRGAPGAAASRRLSAVSKPIKGLSPTDKLALVQRAASSGGAPATGSSMGSYMLLSRATMRAERRGQLAFWDAGEVSEDNVLITPRARGGAVELQVYPDGPGHTYLMEWQVAGGPGSAGEISCSLISSGGSSQTFRLSGEATTIIPALLASPSGAADIFLMDCSTGWRFMSVEVSVLR